MTQEPCRPCRTGTDRGAGTDGVSENHQPIDPAEENVTAAGVAHCAKVTATAIDFLAPAPVDALDLGIVVTPGLPA